MSHAKPDYQARPVKTRKPKGPPRPRDLRKATPEALVSVNEIVAPNGPAPWRRTRFLDAVKAGEAPQPVMRNPRCVRWKYADILEWLDQLAGREA
jgi:predicted DNA-binding transcriptional regulator AlpA